MNKLLKPGLTVGFMICLYVSIPHLAWVFNSYEHGDTTTFWFFWWQPSRAWTNAYLQAISIDGIIALVSLVLTNRKDTPSKGIGYTFVGALILFSWLCNWVYAKAHAPNGGVWNGTILHGMVHLSWVMPIISSALPVFALAFTVMIDKLTGARMSAAELEDQLKEKAALENVRKKYANDGAFAAGLNSFIDDSASVLGHLKRKLPLPQPKEDRKLDSARQMEPWASQKSTSSDVENGDAFQGKVEPREESPAEPQVEPRREEETEPSPIEIDITNRKKPLTVAEAAAVLSCSERNVRDLRQSGTLKVDSADDSLITAGSVRQYMKRRKPAAGKQRHDGSKVLVMPKKTTRASASRKRKVQA